MQMIKNIAQTQKHQSLVCNLAKAKNPMQAIFSTMVFLFACVVMVKGDI